MIRAVYAAAVIVFLFLSSVSANRCCQKDVQLYRRGKCVDGENVTLTCEHKYLVNPKNDYHDNFNVIDGDLYFINQNIPIVAGLYCLGELENSTDEVAVVCIVEDPETYKWVFTSISVVFLTLTIATYVILQALRDLQGKCILNFLVGLDVAFVMLLCNRFNQDVTSLRCEVFGFMMYFFFLMSFFWLNVIAFHMWRTTVFSDKETKSKRTFMMYCIYGYGFPFLLLIISFITHHTDGEHLKPGFGENSCWFSEWKQLWAYFYGPIAFLLTMNCIFFVWTGLKMRQNMKEYSQQKLSYMKYKLWLYLKMFFIMGLSWFFEILSDVLLHKHIILDYFWIITDTINALQGMLLFIILVIMRKRVLRGLANSNVCCKCFPSSWKTLPDDEHIENEDEEIGLSVT